MKKGLLSILLCLTLTAASYAATTTYNVSTQTPIVGANLLTKNGLASSTTKFIVVSGTADNSNYSTNKTVNVSSDDLTYAGNDNETAAVVAYELGHIISGHTARGKMLSLVTTTTTENLTKNTTANSIATNMKTTAEAKEADTLAVDLMYKAGYNPLALIVVLTKQTGSAVETLEGKPANSDRAMNVYNYVAYAYPDKVKAGYSCNEYKNFLTYADTVVKARSTKQVNSNKKAQAKVQKNNATKLSKFKVRGGVSGWDALYNVVNTAKSVTSSTTTSK